MLRKALPQATAHVRSDTGALSSHQKHPDAENKKCAHLKITIKRKNTHANNCGALWGYYITLPQHIKWLHAPRGSTIESFVQQVKNSRLFLTLLLLQPVILHLFCLHRSSNWPRFTWQTVALFNEQPSQFQMRSLTNPQNLPCMPERTKRVGFRVSHRVACHMTAGNHQFINKEIHVCVIIFYVIKKKKNICSRKCSF